MTFGLTRALGVIFTALSQRVPNGAYGDCQAVILGVSVGGLHDLLAQKNKTS
jgi:hypothetical protein